LHNDISDKDCDFCLMVMEDLTKLRVVHAQVASRLENTICELNELKSRPSLLGACLECFKVKLELDVRSLNVKKLETKLLEKSHFWSLHLLVRVVFLSRVSLSILSMITPCSCKMLLISLRCLREPN
jgi:hypothetical protein